MRLCHLCRKWNSGWPLRCRICGAGLEGRLCPRNHVNPTDRSLAFCGDCGQPLERNCGTGISFTPYLLAFAILLLTGSSATVILLLAREAPVTSSLLALALIVIGVRLAVGILPPSARNLIAYIFKGLLNLLLMALFGTGDKGRT